MFKFQSPYIYSVSAPHTLRYLLVEFHVRTECGVHEHDVPLCVNNYQLETKSKRNETRYFTGHRATCTGLIRALPLARLQARHASSQHTLVFPGKLRKKNNIRKTKNKTKTLLAYLGCRNTLYSHTDCQPEPGSVTREGGACIGAVGVVKQARRELSSQHRSSSRSAPARPCTPSAPPIRTHNSQWR